MVGRPIIFSILPGLWKKAIRGVEVIGGTPFSHTLSAKDSVE
jgi:hypothetical protein